MPWRENTHTQSSVPSGDASWSKPSEGTGLWLILALLIPAVICLLLNLWVIGGILVVASVAATLWMSG